MTACGSEICWDLTEILYRVIFMLNITGPVRATLALDDDWAILASPPGEGSTAEGHVIPRAIGYVQSNFDVERACTLR